MTDIPDDFPPDPFPTAGPPWEEIGDANIPPALTALRRPLPDLLFVLYDRRRCWYCYRRLGASEDCGLLCFRDPEQAYAFARACLQPCTYDKVVYVTLDQAHTLARERHALVNCLLLVDDRAHPSVHYIK